MATETLETLIRMRDELTKPLSDQQRALKKVTEQIKTMQKAVVTADREQKKHLDLVKDQRKHTLDLIPGVSKLTGNMEKFGGGMGVAVTAAGATVLAVAAVAAAVAALAIGAAYATVKILEITAAEADWATKTRAMFATMDRSGGSGKTQTKIVTDIAKAMGTNLDDTAKAAQDLLNSGVRNQLELQQSLQSWADATAAGNSQQADALKGLLKRAGEARSGFRGKDSWAGTAQFSTTELQNAGVAYEDYYKELSKLKGRTITQFTQIRVSSKDAMAALNKAAHTRLGPIAEKAWTLDRIKNSWAATWQDMTKNIDFGPLYKELRGLMAVFDPLSQSGESTSKTLTRVVNNIVKAVAWMVHKTAIFALDFQIAFFTAVIAVRDVWNTFATFINTHADVIKGAMLGIGIGLAALTGIFLIAAGLIGAAIFIMFLPLIITVGLVLAGLILLGIAIVEVMKHFDEWKTKATDIASGLINGLVNGITNGMTLVWDSIKKLGTGAIAALKTVLGIASPSKEFAKLGMFSGKGFTQGLQGELSGIDVGVKGKISGGGQPGAIQLGGLTVEINGVEKAEQVIPALMPALADLLEQVMLEYGH